jgi:predicted membrane channel-forming protein YqfA (hemolysin III family)
MSDTNVEAELRHLAERRVAERFGFWSHLAIYLVVNGGLLALNLVTSPGRLWVIFPILGWGVGLAAHGFSVFASQSGVRDRAVEAEMQRLRTRR